MESSKAKGAEGAERAEGREGREGTEVVVFFGVIITSDRGRGSVRDNDETNTCTRDSAWLSRLSRDVQRRLDDADLQVQCMTVAPVVQIRSTPKVPAVTRVG